MVQWGPKRESYLHAGKAVLGFSVEAMQGTLKQAPHCLDVLRAELARYEDPVPAASDGGEGGAGAAAAAAPTPAAGPADADPAGGGGAGAGDVVAAAGGSGAKASRWSGSGQQ
ncbi:hypothetical protein PLESTB_001282800 [Pleodorina starrii]|uniref:Uncharacterized protein n=1 Tax=Pleodorina starrii TaxID=330485 RepID=A0A9W6BSW9_9CHLO|nr:hypothetical protein PLESTB_001282800 [Pleodorina starrii]